MKYIISLALCFNILVSHSQEITTLKNKIDLLISYEEFDMTLPLLDSLIRLEPDSASHRQKLGDCYIGLNKPSLAIPHYGECLKIDPGNGDIFFDLGSCYDLMQMPDSAIFYFLKYANLKKNDPEVYNRLSSIFLDMNNMGDSAIYYAQKALRLDPVNLDSYFSLSFAYFNLSKFPESLHAALKGLSIDSSYSYLLLPAGLSSYYLDDTRSAQEYFIRGWKSPGFEEMFANYYAQSIILSNTHPGKYYKNGDDIYFTDINSGNLYKLISDTKNSESEYYYRKLLIKSKDHLFNMSMDDFIMLYIGFTSDPSYSPYGLDNKVINDLLEKGDYDNFIITVEEMAANNPAHFPLYFYLSEIYKKQGNYQAQLENLVKYFGFSQSILATGTGKSKKEAIIVAFVNHEYEILAELNLRVSQQARVKDKFNYDVLTGLDSSEKEQEIYFNIELPISSLNAILDNKSDKKRKKKKR